MGNSLTVVGTGYQLARQTTPQALACIEQAEKLFYLVNEPVTAYWLEQLNPTAESLYNSYGVGKHRAETYEEMTERILAPLRAGVEVCAAFYGHPGVLVCPGHESVRRARREGFEARMLPAISAEDCLYADLDLDPGVHGCQSFEATDFLVHRRRFDPSSPLILWQIGAVGTVTFKNDELWNLRGLRALVEVLEQAYPPEHEVVVYETTEYPIFDPRILRVPLAKLFETRVTVISTLYVPPKGPAPVDLEMAARLGMQDL